MMKAKFAVLRQLINASDFSWNDIEKTIKAEYGVWRAYLKVIFLVNCVFVTLSIF